MAQNRPRFELAIQIEHRQIVSEICSETKSAYKTVETRRLLNEQQEKTFKAQDKSMAIEPIEHLIDQEVFGCYVISCY